MECVPKIMTDYADLEIGLHRRDGESYAIDFRFSQPNSETDVRLGQGRLSALPADLNGLGNLVYDPTTYGESLTRLFFADPDVRTAFEQARASAQSLGLVLRLRLMIGPSAPELNNLHWETLQDPQDNSPLSTNGNLLFSRYLSSMDWRPVRIRAKSELHALVLIANPTDLADYNLAAVDVDAEQSRVRQALGNIPLSVLSDAAGAERATLNNLMTFLRDNTCDILCLVCHGALIKEEAWLWLEDDQGKVAMVSGSELVVQIKELEERPRLVFLASCESAGARSGDALAALGPRLAEAGIPAVLAMQDKVSLETTSAFTPQVFRELQQDGQIDRAVAVARGTVRERPDYWVPALYMRLKSGRLWYVPGFGSPKDDFEEWTNLASFIQDKTCTPILGPGLTEKLWGSRREMAIRWAEEHGFPLAPQDKDNLPRVAQYVLTHLSPAYLPIAVREILHDSILRRYPSVVTPGLAQAKVWSNAQLIQAIGLAHDYYRSANPANPYRQLAKMRLPIYLTTDTTGLTTRALAAEGAEPVVRICPWNKSIPKEIVIFEDTPSPDKPLVYHLYGHVSVPKSLVYSEDNYFDYLIGVTLNKSLIPSAVRAALTNTSLLFLGFQVDDWEFRTFFRFLMTQEGRELLKFYSHAAAQIEPEEDRIVDAKRAHKYLEEYFTSENIRIFWGSPEEFLTAIWQHL